MGEKIEAYWDCPYCGSKANLGRYRNCPNCGRPRGESTKFYLIEKDKFVDDSVVPKGPDWFCESCDSYNTFSANFCTSCGAPKGASKNYFEMHNRNSHESSEDHNTTSSTSSSSTNTTQKEEDIKSAIYSVTSKKGESYSSSSSNSYAKKSHRSFSSFNFFKNNFKIILISFLVLCLIAGITYIFISKPATIHVVQTSWSRSIDIQLLKTVRESDWHIPAGGRLVYTQNEIRSYEQVFDHYETEYEDRSETYISGYREESDYIDLGNGYYERTTRSVPEYSVRHYSVPVQKPVYRSEPVYDTKYYYDIDKWFYERSVNSSGSSDKDPEPYWPTVILKEKERTSSKYENFFVSAFDVKDKDMTVKKYNISRDLWETVEVDSVINVSISLSTITKINTE